MASRDDHVKQWRHNRRFLPTIDPAYHDWIVTVTFYTALHAVDALLAHDKIPVNSHQSRNETLRRVTRYDKIERSYLPLYNLARTVRYSADPNRWIPVEQIRGKVIVRHLYPIETSVQKLIGLDLSLEAIDVRC